MKKNKVNIFRAVLMCLSIILLTIAAFIMPKTVYSIYDRKMIGKEESLSMEIVPYEKEGEFSEQIKSFAMCIYEGDKYQMSAVHMEEGNSSVSNEELNNIVNNEINLYAYEEFIVDNGMLKVEQLNKRELYTVYINVPENEDGRDSITLWLLNYKLDGSQYNEVEVLIDMEYHKIYDIWVYSDGYQYIVDEKYGYYDAQETENYLMAEARKNLFSYDSYDLVDMFVDKMRTYYSTNEKLDIVQVSYNDIEDRYIESREYFDNYVQRYLNEKDENELLYLFPIAKVYGKNDRGYYMRMGIDGIRNVLQL